MFSHYTMVWYNYVVGLVSVIGFFVGSNELTKRWANFSPKVFVRQLFVVGLLLRIAWVLCSYLIYTQAHGEPFEFQAADAYMYHSVSSLIAREGFSTFAMYMYGTDISDQGYIAYLTANYMVYGDSILIARIVKAVVSAFTAVLVYKLAARNFGENVGKMAGIFCMLMPNMIYYCGVHYKEVEMVFATVAAIERADYAIRSPKLSFGNLVLPILFAAILLTFRTVLSIAVLFAFITAICFTTKRTGSHSKRIVLGVWVVVAIATTVGGKLLEEAEETWNRRDSAQEASMEWRSQREGGNKYSTLASKSVFAPMIFVLPFATEVDIVTQPNHQLAHGGYFVKNLMAFFVMFALFLLVMDVINKGNKWRDYILVGSFLAGYLFIIASSQFAQAERFHMPAVPFFLMFAAYGIANSNNKTKFPFMIYLVILGVALIAWQWFKLAGRGLA